MAQAWLPPDNPNPSEILTEGGDDIRIGRYDVALCKFEWFHENALKWDRHLSAVRLSFGLGYWYELAKRYPPAREALCATRDRAEKAFLASHFEFEHFHELAAINNRLEEDARTASLFSQAAAADMKAARRIYHVAEEYLIQVGDYVACAPFLDPERVQNLADVFQMLRKRDEARAVGSDPLPDRGRIYFVDRVATLVTLLVLNDRSADAAAVYTKSLETLDDEEFRTKLDAAMTGHFPPPRFSPPPEFA